MNMHNILPETRDWVRMYMKKRTSNHWSCRTPGSSREAGSYFAVVTRSTRNACVRRIDELMREQAVHRFRQRLLDEAAKQSSEDPRFSFSLGATTRRYGLRYSGSHR